MVMKIDVQIPDLNILLFTFRDSKLKNKLVKLYFQNFFWYYLKIKRKAFMFIEIFVRHSLIYNTRYYQITKV